MMTRQQPPQRQHVTGHPVRRADDQDRVIQHRQCPLRLRRKIDMSRRIHQDETQIFIRKARLLGEDRDAARTLHRIIVQVGVLMIHAARRADHAGGVEHALRQCGLSRVHVRQYSDRDRLGSAQCKSPIYNVTRASGDGH